VAGVSDNASDVGEKRRYDVFVSYNRAEGSTVERIARRLRAEGLEVFFDRWVMSAGQSWQDEILDAMQGAAACGVFIGSEGLGDWAREELAVAQLRAAHDPRFRLFMVLLTGAPSPLDPRLAFLSTRNWVDLRPHGDDRSGFEHLLEAVTGVPQRSQTPTLDTTACPYRGLEPFDERHANLFFGREDDTRRLCERLSDTRFVAVLGASGSGKSSVVKAGLIPALRADAVPHSAEWTIRTMTPGGNPLAGLGAQLAHVSAGDSMQRTVDALAADQRTVDLAVALATADKPTDHRFVLVVDQLEEVFTLCQDEDERSAFLANLIYAATIPGGRTIVVVTLRADFYYRCAPYPGVRSVLAVQHMLIGPLGEEALRRAIERPAWGAELTLEPGLVDTIVTDVGDRPGTLPLLQHVLLQLWQRRRGRLLTLEAYVESGGVQGALAKHADAVYDQLSESQRDLTERVLLRLIQPGEGTEDSRRRVDVDELLTASDEPGTVEAVIGTLADERLLTTSRDEVSEARLIEITHEALLQGWPRLRRWIERDREALLAHRRLTEACREWERSGRDDALLYRGTRLTAWRRTGDKSPRSRRARLTDTVEWPDRRNQSLNQLEREFLDASEKREHRERAARRRRIRLVFAGLVTALAVITVVAIVAVHQAGQAQDQRDVALSRELAASATNMLTADPALSLALARRAVATQPTAQAGSALRQAVLGFRELGLLRAPAAPVYGADMSRDERQVVAASRDGELNIWDRRDGRLLMTARAHRRLVAAPRFGPDGRWVASGGADGTITITDVARRTTRRITRDPGVPAYTVAVAPDGARVAAGFEDGTIRIARANGRAPVLVLSGYRGPVGRVAFSRDGRRVAGAGWDGTIRVWQMNGKGRPLIMRGLPTGSVSFDPDGRRLISGDARGWIHFWNLATGAEESKVRAGRDAIDATAFSPDGRQIAASGEDGAIRLIDTAGRYVTAVLRGHGGRAQDVGFGSKGDVVISAGDDGTVRTWDPGRARVMRGPVTGAQFSSDGARVISGGTDGTVRIWDVASGRLAARLRGHAKPSFARFSDDGREAVSASQDGTVRVWRAPGWRQPQIFHDNGREVYAATFDHTGRRLVIGAGDGRVIVRPLSGGPARVLTRHHGTVNDVEFSPDGHSVASAADDGLIKISRIDTPSAPVTVLRGHVGAVNTAVFSHDGRRLVSAGDDGTIRVWLLDTKQSVVLRGHVGRVSTAAFDPSGDQVVSAGYDGSVRLWDARGGPPLVTLHQHGDIATSAAFSPDGTRFLSAGYDGIVWLAPCEACGGLDDVLRLARTRLGRALNAAERQRFLEQP
jgi:WD40 repeat protein